MAYGVAYPQPTLDAIFNAANFGDRSQASGGLQSVNLANVTCQNLTCSGNTLLSSLQVTGTANLGSASVTVGDATINDLTANRVVVSNGSKKLVSSTLTQAMADTLHHGLSDPGTTGNISFATSGTLSTATLQATGLTSANLVQSSTSGVLSSSSLTALSATALQNGLTGTGTNGNISFATSGTLTTSNCTARGGLNSFLAKGAAGQAAVTMACTSDNNIAWEGTFGLAAQSNQIVTGSAAGDVVLKTATNTKLRFAVGNSTQLEVANLSVNVPGAPSGATQCLQVGNVHATETSLTVGTYTYPNVFEFGVAEQKTNFNPNAQPGDCIIRTGGGALYLQSGTTQTGLLVNSFHDVVVPNNLNVLTRINPNYSDKHLSNLRTSRYIQFGVNAPDATNRYFLLATSTAGGPGLSSIDVKGTVDYRGPNAALALIDNTTQFDVTYSFKSGAPAWLGSTRSTDHPTYWTNLLVTSDGVYQRLYLVLNWAAYALASNAMVRFEVRSCPAIYIDGLGWNLEAVNLTDAYVLATQASGSAPTSAWDAYSNTNHLPP